jgi:hypothetical protein
MNKQKEGHVDATVHINTNSRYNIIIYHDRYNMIYHDHASEMKLKYSPPCYNYPVQTKNVTSEVMSLIFQPLQHYYSTKEKTAQ